MIRYAFGFALVIVTGCGGGREPHRTEAASAPPVQVSVIEARITEWPSVYEAPGTVRALTSSTLASRVMGYVREVNVTLGDRVKAGQLLVVIDSRDLESSVLEAKAAEQAARSGVAEAENGVAAAKAQLGLAQVTFARMEDLFTKKSISNQEFDEAQARLRTAEAAYQIAVSRRTQVEARIAQARQAVDSASVMRSHAEIRAPFSGVVTEKRVETGQMATPGTPLLTVEQTGSYRLEVPVQESMLGTIREGQTVSVDLMEQTLTARVTEIVPSVDPSSRTFLVKATLPPSPALRSGLFGRMRVHRGTEQSLTVPADSIVTRGSLQSVFAVDGGAARMRMITAGETRDGQVRVLSGLQAGERVIHPRPLNLADGTPVEVRR